jgi:hypothetical protein
LASFFQGVVSTKQKHIMKKIILLAVVITATAIQANAQSMGSSYKTALGVKFYPGAGITVKHFVKAMLR